MNSNSTPLKLALSIFAFSLLSCNLPAYSQTALKQTGVSTRQLQSKLIQLDTLINNAQRECARLKKNKEVRYHDGYPVYEMPNAGDSAAKMFWCMQVSDARHQQTLIHLELQKRGVLIP